MTADDHAHLLAAMPMNVADRVMTAVFEGRPVDAEDAATVAAWVQDACAALSGARRVETMTAAYSSS